MIVLAIGGAVAIICIALMVAGLVINKRRG